MELSAALSKLALEGGPGLVPAHPPRPIPVPIPGVSDSASTIDDVALLPPPIEIQQASSAQTAAVTAATPDKKRLPVLVKTVMAARAFKRAASLPIPAPTPSLSLPVPLPPPSRPTTLVPPRQQPHAAAAAAEAPTSSSSMPTLARILRDRQGSSGLEDGPTQTPPEPAVPASQPSALASAPDGASLPLPSIPSSAPLPALEASVSGSGSSGTESSSARTVVGRSSSEECIEGVSTLADVRRAATVAAEPAQAQTMTTATAAVASSSLLPPSLAPNPAPRRPQAFTSLARRPLLPQATNGGGGVPSPRSLGGRAVLEPLSPSTGGTTNGGAPGSLPPLRSLPSPASTLLAPALDSPRMPPPSAALPLGQPFQQQP